MIDHLGFGLGLFPRHKRAKYVVGEENNERLKRGRGDLVKERVELYHSAHTHKHKSTHAHTHPHSNTTLIEKKK